MCRCYCILFGLTPGQFAALTRRCRAISLTLPSRRPFVSRSRFFRDFRTWPHMLSGIFH